MKRGDVHAETSADVVADEGGRRSRTRSRPSRARAACARVALQAHVAGPIVKFYAVADGSFFCWYPGQLRHREDRHAVARRSGGARASASRCLAATSAFPQSR